MEPLRYHGNEVIMFHILDPQEMRRRSATPCCAGYGDARASGGVAGVRAARIPAARSTRTSRRCATRRKRAGIDYFLMDTSRPLDDALREYLAIRREALDGLSAPWFLGGLLAVGLPV